MESATHYSAESAEDVPSDPIPEFDYDQSQSFDDCASSA
jgi:hypothetical protein